MARTKSSAWATRSASQSWSSVASGSPYRRLLPTVPLKRNGFLRHQTDARPDVLQGGIPDIDAAETKRSAADVVEPGHKADERRLARTRRADDGRHLTGLGAETQAAQHRLLGPGVTEVDISELDANVRPAGIGVGWAGWWTLDSVSSTSLIRPAETAARGIIIDIITPIITLMRICIR
jgi:hypothetical protein